MFQKQFWSNFVQLMGSVFTMFFFAVVLGEPTAEIILKMNDKTVHKTAVEQAVFWVGAFISTGVWCLLWVWFKKSEKICVDYWLSQKAAKK